MVLSFGLPVSAMFRFLSNAFKSNFIVPFVSYDIFAHCLTRLGLPVPFPANPDIFILEDFLCSFD